MSKFFGILTLVFLVLIFGFGECRASVSEKQNILSSFFEKRERRQETTIIRIANHTNCRIFCILEYGGEKVSGKMLGGELLCYHVKNQYNYELPTYSKATLRFFAVYQGKIVSLGKELKIKLFGSTPAEIVLIILPGTDGNLLKVETK